MCLGNHATVSSRYINGQLRTLHDNARYCVEQHGTGSKPTMTALEYAMCLAEFYVPTKYGDGVSFFAKFGCPQVEFVCNHDVVLSLNLLEGRYAIDYNATTTKQEQLANIENLTLEFRLSFKQRASGEFACPDIGTRDFYTIGLHVFVMEAANFLQSRASSGGSAYSNDQLGALVYYITTFYLPTLKKAGHHALHSLPGFAASTSTVEVDYSVISTRDLTHAELFGVTVQDINNGFQELWSKATEFIRSHEFSEDAVGKSFLAEMRSSKSIGGDTINIKLHLGPVQIQALCETEIILYLNITDIHVYDEGFEGVPKEKLRDWRIAFIIDVFEDTHENHIRYVRFDVNHARISECRSHYNNEYDPEVLERVKEAIIEKTVPSFFDAFEKERDNISKYVFPPPPYDELIDEEFVEKQILQYTDTGSFELITALTQASMNAHFKSAYSVAHRIHLGATSGGAPPPYSASELPLERCLSYFSVLHQDRAEEVLFEAKFSAPELQLICEEGSHRVILHLHLVDGQLKPVHSRNSESSSNAYRFSNWRVAFEVDLKLIKSSASTVSSTILGRVRAGRATEFYEIVLSMSSARHVPIDIRFPAPEDSYRKALLYFIQECYFPVFESARHHVLYTMPANLDSTRTVSSMFKALKFEIVPFIGSNGAQYREGLVGANCIRNSIVITGMSSDRPLTEDTIPRGRNWVYNSVGDSPIGTVYLSRKSFLDGIILKVTEYVNHVTTIVPVWSGINNARWIFELKTWDLHEAKIGLACKWREMATEGNIEKLEFAWRNKELWNYENDYDGDVVASFHCRTSNNLSVPVGRMDKSGINISGMVEIRMKYESRDNAWSSEMSVTWTATIAFASTASGLQVQLYPAQIQFPQLSTPKGASGYETQADALEKLRRVFPETIDLTNLVNGLKEILEGAWTGVQVQEHEFCVTRPAFNRHGDLLLDLMILESPAGVNGTNQQAANGE